MFTVHCPTHGGAVLLSERAITRLVNTPHGIEMHWRCFCGTEGIELTGLLADADADPAAAPPRREPIPA